MKSTSGRTVLCLLTASLLAVLDAGAGEVAANANTAINNPAVSARRMSDLVKELASPKYAGRLPGTAGDRLSLNVIVSEFKAIGLSPAGTQDYVQPFTTTIVEPDGESHGNPENPLLGERMATSNVIGIIPGNDPELSDEIIIISAHRDHLGQTPDGVHYPGANDDLSGLASVMELARLFMQHKGGNKRTLMFIAYGAEEQHEMGSMHHVAHPLPDFPNENIVLMISIDMIGQGYDKWSSFTPAQLSRYANTWFDEVYNGINDDSDEYSHEYPPQKEATFSYDAGPFGKIGINNRVFGKAEGIEHYHKTTDTWENVRFAPAAIVTKTIFDFLWKVDQDPRAHIKP
ncbi:M28 family metallopeptidase [Massilia antarctica]|uniref:M28 family metallopeptidase n=1 Tax=Massilia antarctica TaxID=2765360 RepID=UPI0006BB7FBF|nr:M28 family peptidase [Massilia sp. H27-R4]MCY0913783.1 M28 family peptidase [Massilia sp. H27-R4]CUI04538.1 Aminopeptidase Y [Janthinobacterium sp. CG23_2]CUU28324.1 Aminopeptidase Y [Janthinobacterium sp. CG23_2]